MRKKEAETREHNAEEEKTIAQITSEALDAEEKKKKRIRRGKKQIILDKVNMFYKDRTEKTVFDKEFAKISASLDAIEDARIKTQKLSETALFKMYTVEELQEMIQKRQGGEIEQ